MVLGRAELGWIRGKKRIKLRLESRFGRGFGFGISEGELASLYR